MEQKHLIVGTIPIRYRILEEIVEANIIARDAYLGIRPIGPFNPIILDPPVEFGRVPLPIDHERGLIIRNDKGFPLQSNGEIDWEKTSQEKQSFIEKFDRMERQGSSRKPHRKHRTNYTPPKKKRKK